MLITRFHAIVAVVTIVAFAVVIILIEEDRIKHRRHRYMARLGKCPNCDYDLRATPIRCPERGRTIFGDE